MLKLHKPARAFIDALNTNGVTYCHFKSNAHVADAFTAKDDLDILVARGDITHLSAIAQAAGYKRFVLPPQRAYIGIEDYLALDADAGTFSHLHLHYRLTLGDAHSKSYTLPFERGVLSRRVFDEENCIYITSHEDELWLLNVRAALKKRHRDIIRPPRPSSEREWLLARIDCPNNEQSPRELRKNMQLYRRYNPLVATIVRWKREAFRVVHLVHKRVKFGARNYRRTPIAGGRIIAFLGPDGAGKSSVIAAVVKAYARVMDVSSIYMGSGDGKSSLMRAPLKFAYRTLLKRGALDRKSRKVTAEGAMRSSEKAGGIRKIGQIPWAMMLSRERTHKLRMTARLRANGYIVITDRYPQTQICGMCDGPRHYIPNQNADTAVKRAEKRCFDIANMLKPDVEILLKVSPEIALERKPDEVDIESHKNLMNMLEELDFGTETTRIVINADQPLERVIAEVMHAIWGAI